MLMLNLLFALDFAENILKIGAVVKVKKQRNFVIHYFSIFEMKLEMGWGNER